MRPPPGAARLAARFPVAWHVAEAEGLAAILAHGLLPANVLRARDGRPPDRRNRDAFEVLAGPAGPAVVRLQLMPDRHLVPTLRGAFAGDPAAWRHHVDAHAFLWLRADRRDRFRAAVARLRAREAERLGLPPPPPPATLALDTAAVLAAAGDAAFVTRVNSGSTRRAGARVARDEATFEPAATYAGPLRGRDAVELAVRGRVPATAILGVEPG